MVSGQPPMMGCAPGNLALLASPNRSDYEDDTGCLNSEEPEPAVQGAQLAATHWLTRLSGMYPGVRVTYADLYSPVIGLAASPGRFGFDATNRGLSCCGDRRAGGSN